MHPKTGNERGAVVTATFDWTCCRGMQRHAGHAFLPAWAAETVTAVLRTVWSRTCTFVATCVDVLAVHVRWRQGRVITVSAKADLSFKIVVDVYHVAFAGRVATAAGRPRVRHSDQTDGAGEWVKDTG